MDRSLAYLIGMAVCLDLLALLLLSAFMSIGLAIVTAGGLAFVVTLAFRVFVARPEIPRGITPPPPETPGPEDRKG